MTTLAGHIIVAGAENRPPILEKSMYDSWASRICLFIKGKKHGRMMLDSIDNDDCDVQATNIILHGLPPDVYALVNHQEAAKDIWDRVKLLMKGTDLSYQERECRLYNLFDKFPYVQGETLHEYYYRFSQMINDMHTIGMTMQQVQVNTKFLNALPSEWSKFVTDVKLAKSLYTTNYDQLYTYLSQHERHVNEVCITRERYLDPLALVANSPTLYNPSQSPQHSGSLMYPPPQQFTPVYEVPIHHQHHHTPVSSQQHSVSPQPFMSPSVTQQSQAEFPQLDFSVTVPMFQQGEDPIECINKAMAFLSVVTSRFPPSNNQLRTSSNPRNQATIQDGESQFNKFKEDKIRVMLVLEATTSKGNYAAGQPRVMECYNCRGEGHMARQCTQVKRPRNATWFKEKLMLAEAQEAAFQTEDLNAYDFDCNDLSSAKVVLMANLSSCDPEVLFEDTNSSTPNDLWVLSLVEHMTDHVAHLDKENQTNKMVNESLTVELERYNERVTIFEQRLNVDLNKHEKLIDSQMDDLIRNRNSRLAAFQQEIDTLKETLSNHVKEKESL
ncbi:integrase, catalytic region, zinc finger, CCHC-type containing protein [Tanacetum coccineum]